MNKTDNAQLEIVKSSLTWGHKITLIGLAMSCSLMVAGIVLLVLYPSLANEITDYISEWLPFCISVILGYSAKSTLENGVKIYSAMKTSKTTVSGNSENGNG